MMDPVAEHRKAEGQFRDILQKIKFQSPYQIFVALHKIRKNYFMIPYAYYRISITYSINFEGIDY